jgi:superfamily II DNA helicase RecQ
LLAVKIEDDREEAVPLTQPQSKERIEVMRRATTHMKKFLATKGEHVMTDDFFFSAQTNINEFDIEQLTKEKKKRLKATEVDEVTRAVLVKRSFAIQTSTFDSLNKTELDCLLRWHGVVPGAKMLKETKVLKLKHIFESNPNLPPRDLWTAENKERLQSLKEMEISLEDTAIGRNKIVLEQQLSSAMLSMLPTKWNELLEIRKQKWGKEGVVLATYEVIGGAEGV